MIEETIKQIEAQIQAAESLTPERRQELVALLATLKTEAGELAKTHRNKRRALWATPRPALAKLRAQSRTRSCSITRSNPCATRLQILKNLTRSSRRSSTASALCFLTAGSNAASASNLKSGKSFLVLTRLELRNCGHDFDPRPPGKFPSVAALEQVFASAREFDEIHRPAIFRHDLVGRGIRDFFAVRLERPEHAHRHHRRIGFDHRQSNP